MLAATRVLYDEYREQAHDPNDLLHDRNDQLHDPNDRPHDLNDQSHDRNDTALQRTAATVRTPQEARMLRRPEPPGARWP
ncbi:hypothetical protein [Actinomadura rupiterrae]|uniref:hypothetical protein n=1 Tax=Actinomadura rupiterrae TaxID=559627 RepID=UPI0020A321C8|nr:hypothetical protein [Actinomadura rupiterrae]MCP2334782.1 hypothetical protein [Actinomadura rupiterrae]